LAEVKPWSGGPIPAGAAAIVVRMWTSAPRHQLILDFVRGDVDGSFSGSATDIFQTDSPVRFLWASGPLLQKTFVFVVRPGRWRLLGPIGISLCLGAPAFDVGPDEAVFAGSFDAAAKDYLAPDLSLDAVRPTLTDQTLAARLKPAEWVNGVTSPCGISAATVLYRYDMPNTRHVDSAETARRN